VAIFRDLYRNLHPLVDRTTVHTYASKPVGAQRKLPGADTSRPTVSLIATVKNEGDTMAGWLASIDAQTRKPDEIVIVDGGSTDDTWSILQAHAERSPIPMKILLHPGANIARGRNLAIEAAASPIIACTDAGCMLDEDWLAALTGPFADDERIEVVAGYFRASVTSDLQRAIAAYMIAPIDLVNAQSFLPSARSVAFTRQAWARAGGFPEWLTLTAEDTLFDILLKGKTHRWAFVPEAQVEWRLKSSLRALFAQVQTYARGDGEAGLFAENYRRQIHLWICLLLFALMGVTGTLLAIVTGGAGWLALLVFASTLIAYRIRRITIRPNWATSGLKRMKATCQSVLVVLTMTLAQSIGFISGVGRRARMRETSSSTRIPSPTQ